MKITKVISLLLVLGLCGCSRKSPPERLSCAIVHRPASGCPAGYEQESRPRFTERDGSKQFACVSTDVQKEPCTDLLMPGESEEMTIILDPREVPSEHPQATNGKI